MVFMQFKPKPDPKSISQIMKNQWEMGGGVWADVAPRLDAEMDADSTFANS